MVTQLLSLLTFFSRLNRLFEPLLDALCQRDVNIFQDNNKSLKKCFQRQERRSNGEKNELSSNGLCVKNASGKNIKKRLNPYK